MQKNDLIRVRHMLDAANEINSFLHGKSKTDFMNNRMMVLAIVRNLEIIGEAANKVSGEVKDSFTEIPWVDIVNMRHHLIHVYYDIDLNIIWDTVVKDMPQLTKHLEVIVQRETGFREEPKNGK